MKVNFSVLKTFLEGGVVEKSPLRCLVLRSNLNIFSKVHRRLLRGMSSHVETAGYSSAYHHYTIIHHLIIMRSSLYPHRDQHLTITSILIRNPTPRIQSFGCLSAHSFLPCMVHPCHKDGGVGHTGPTTSTCLI